MNLLEDIRCPKPALNEFVSDLYDLVSAHHTMIFDG